MDSTKDLPNATSDTSVTDVATIKTPQRRARYHDKSRWMLKSLKAAVFLETKIRSSGILKRCLRRLGVKLDLRLTSAWKAVRFELVEKIRQVKAMVDPTHQHQSAQQHQSATPQFKKGDRVKWTGYSPLESSACIWEPFVIGKIENGMAYLDYLYRPVPVEEIELAG